MTVMSITKTVVRALVSEKCVATASSKRGLMKPVMTATLITEMVVPMNVN